MTFLRAAFLSLIMMASLSSCFTGIESTKKVTLSREDKKSLSPTEEELFLIGIEGIPLAQWQEGSKKFIVTDEKAYLILEYIPFDKDKSSSPDIKDRDIKGRQLVFQGVLSRIEPSGGLNAVIVFSDDDGMFRYDTGKNFDVALNETKSDQIPLLIDLDLVEKAGDLLIGKKLWTKSPLWYDENGNRIEGKKFAPVTIMDVQPGDINFPIKVKISDDNGKTAWMFMNIGNGGTESRAFHHLFSLSDLRKKYPNIQPETWDLISRGKLAPGMTKEECKLAIGNPSEVNSGHDYSQTLDIWTYDDGSVLWFEDGILTKYR